MAKQQRNYMPQSSGGLVNYYDESAKGPKIRPEHIVGAIAILVAFELIVKFVL
ncbi:MAG: preprotein translocase subunit Sec61beta [Nanoarchaeota archaeon]|nr:preprotein translocase subunit Sec61beta [Nanoarchaeota archaeon]